MKTTIKKWGNGPAICIPHRILAAASLSLGDEVHIRKDNARIIIEPTQPLKYDLEDLLKRITPKNQHKAVNFGKPE